MSHASRALIRSLVPIVPPYTSTDDFTRVDSTTSLGTATTGEAWTAHFGTWGISSDKAYCVTAGGDAVATIDSTRSDMTLEVSYTPGAASGAGIVFRATNHLNYLLVLCTTGVGISLWQRVAGSYTQLANSATGGSFTAGVTYQVKVVAASTSIITYKDGVQTLSHTTSQFLTGTRVGLRENATSTTRWDNLTVL